MKERMLKGLFFVMVFGVFMTPLGGGIIKD